MMTCRKSFKELKFRKMNQLEHNVQLPFLINKDNIVVLGNSLVRERWKSKKDIDCIVVENDLYLERILYQLESALVEENDFERIHSIEATMKGFIISLKEPFETMSLFDAEPEKGFINEDIYSPSPKNRNVQKIKEKIDFHGNLVKEEEEE